MFIFLRFAEGDIPAKIKVTEATNNIDKKLAKNNINDPHAPE